jgi:hypothetical protein
VNSPFELSRAILTGLMIPAGFDNSWVVDGIR